MGNKRQRRGKKKNSQSTKRQRRSAPKKLWAEDCLELLPPEIEDDGAAEGQSHEDINSQLWVKITASVVSKGGKVNKEDGIQDEAQVDDNKSSDTDPPCNGPKGVWWLEESAALSPTNTLHHSSTEGLVAPGAAVGDSQLPPSEKNSSPATTQPTASILDTSTPALPSSTEQRNIFIQRVACNIPKLPKGGPLKHLPNGDCGDGIQNPLKDVPDKYWAQRRSLFSKFDNGIQMVDAESWYSVTPEAIARHIAARICRRSSSSAAATTSKKIILDAFCGIGGNAIAFALRQDVELVVCVDTDITKLKAAAHNCYVYQVPKEKVIFVNCDICEVLRLYEKGVHVVGGSDKQEDSNDQVEDDHKYRMGSVDLLPSRLDSIFLSPPWGGVDYMEHGNRHFNLDCIKLSNDFGGKGLLRLSLKALKVPDVAVFLPRNLNGLMVAQDCFDLGIRGTIEVERNYVEHKLKTITVYIRSSTD